MSQNFVSSENGYVTHHGITVYVDFSTGGSISYLFVLRFVHTKHVYIDLPSPLMTDQKLLFVYDNPFQQIHFSIFPVSEQLPFCPAEGSQCCVGEDCRFSVQAAWPQAVIIANYSAFVTLHLRYIRFPSKYIQWL